ncbi:MAG TPA: phage holin family protein [Chitinophagaceae bacterium]|nr:phage holin family protein [Chitinophagaceae bacterium]
MGNEENFFRESKQKVEEYVKDRLLLAKLEAVEKISRLTATMFTGLIIALFAFFIILFVSIMAGYLFGELIHHIYWGFGIVAGLYIILLVLIIIFRKHLIEKRVTNMVIDILFDKNKDDNDSDNIVEQVDALKNAPSPGTKQQTDAQ